MAVCAAEPVVRSHEMGIDKRCFDLVATAATELVTRHGLATSEKWFPLPAFRVGWSAEARLLALYVNASSESGRFAECRLAADGRFGRAALAHASCPYVDCHGARL